MPKLRRRTNIIKTPSYGTLEPRQLLAADIPDFVGDGKIGEVDTVLLNSNWTTINLDQAYNNPVVIAGSATSLNETPVTVRVRDVTSNSFQIALENWDYLGGGHPNEIVSYLVVEGGTHQLTDGTRLVAGYVQDQTHELEPVSTDGFFNSTPVLFSQIMTDNDPAAATTRIDVLGNNDFEIRIQEEEGADNIHGAETVGFVAIESAVGTSGDLAFQSFATGETVTQDVTTVSLAAGGFSTAPAIFASMQTFNDSETATVRNASFGSFTNTSFFVQEEQSSDTELNRVAGESVGVLAIDNGDLIAGVVAQGSDRFIALEEHIRGIDSLTVAQLQSWTNAFANEANSLGNRLEDFVAAVEVVELYEAEVGPLFTSEGVSNFNRLWNGDNNLGRGLARAMVSVYQAVFDAIDNDLVNEFPTIVEGTFFRSTENFPGSVPNPTDPTAIYEVQIDGTLNEEFGYVGGYSTNAARRFTGAYLAPGTIAEVIVPDELVNAGYQVRVGGHSWDLSNKNNVNRLFRVSNLFDITDNVVQIANPMGGNIYIEVPVGVDAGIVDVQFRNTIRAPFFSNRTFDKTTQSEWNVERTHPGAFTDIESEHSLFTVPTKWITNLGYNNLLEIIEAYDANMRVATEYAGKNPDRHKASLYAIVDTQIRGNAFSIGYPQSNWGSFSQNTIRAPLTLNAAFDKVLWHEHGHSEFLSMFAGETESLVHMAAFYIGVENYGFTIQEAFANSLAYGSTRHTTSDALNSWVVMDEFINGQNMAFQQGSYRPRGHADYVEYVELFGLDALRNFNRRVNIEFDGTNLQDSFDEGGRTSHNYNSRILRLSREAGVNVAPLFHLWGHAPSNLSALNASLAAEGLGDSVKIYDRLIDARDSVPLTQAEWDAVDSVMRDFLNENRGPWQALRTNYDVGRGQDAINRIQELIDLHFPSGRPTDGPAVTPIAATVTAFSEPNFQGESWELTEGL
ncbi:M60 family metallopeptidase, partial [Mariniblastus sp.]|nr:M60 family metallopeptidase [Mariniblastus sp.]